MSRGYRTKWKVPEEVRHADAYVEAGRAHAFGQAVYDRRTDLGLSQSQLADRAGMTQPGVSRIELGGTVPTLPLLARLAEAMESELDVHIAPATGGVTVTFTSTHGNAA